VKRWWWGWGRGDGWVYVLHLHAYQYYDGRIRNTPERENGIVLLEKRVAI
jgi:hypothetical protein